MMTVIDKYKLFEEFKKNSKSLFEKIEGDYNNKKVKELYSFIIAPGGRIGGVDKRIVELFYGKRPFDNKKKLQGFEVTSEIQIEHGATLHYNQLDNGHVIASLYPAGTKDLKVIEDNIFISIIDNPEKLKKIKFLKLHWKMFNAYMNVTSLEGEPSLYDKIIVWYLRNFKKIIIDKKLNPPRYKKFITGIIKFSLTVGLSGFLLLIISKCNNQDEMLYNKINSIDNTQKEILSILNHEKNKPDLTNIQNALDKINSNLEIISKKRVK